MTPAQLQPESFRSYQPQARTLAEQNLALLRTLPLSFLPLLLREVIAYDRKFPAERREIDHQLAYLGLLSEADRQRELAPFREIQVGEELQHLDWVSEPARFSEALSAHLWSTHQIDGFHAAAVSYMGRANGNLQAPSLKLPRLTIVLIGRGVRESNYPLFRKLRRHGAYLSNVDPEGGSAAVAALLNKRYAQTPDPYAHWAISGAAPVAGLSDGIAAVSYEALAEPRAAMAAVLRRSFESGMGAEALRSRLAAMTPADIGLSASSDPALTWFQLSLLSEGSGTQIFSTSFVQWAAREALRRAQPLTLMARFAPRRQASSMKDLLNPNPVVRPALDPEGSLIDADMAAYQTWLNLQRLPGSESATFVGWFEGHREMVIVGPKAEAGKTDSAPTTWDKLTSRIV